MPLTNTIGTAAARSYGFLTKSGIGGKIIFYTDSSYDLTIYNTQSIGTDSSQNSFFNFANSSPHWTLFQSNANGTINFQVNITSSYGTYGYGAYTDSSNNIYACGADLGQIYRSYEAANIYKFNSSGTLQWKTGVFQNNTYPNTNYTLRFNACTSDSSGNVIGVGYFYYNGAQIGFIAKFNSSGTYSWSSANGNANTLCNDYYSSCVTDSAGNTYVAGAFGNLAVTGYPLKPVFGKYNSSGTPLFHYQLRDTVVQPYSYNSITTDGTYYYTAGRTYDGTKFSGLVVKYDANGTLQFQRIISSSSSIYFNQCKYNSSGHVYLCGVIGNNILIIKLDTSGNIVWQKQISTSIALIGYSFYIDATKIVINATIATSPKKFVEIVFPASIGITGTYSANGYTFTCSDSSVTSTGSSLTNISLSSLSGLSPLLLTQSTFGTVNTITEVTANVTDI